jgi:hypothetical protein
VKTLWIICTIECCGVLAFCDCRTPSSVIFWTLRTGELYNWGCDEGDRRLGLGSRGGPGAAGSLSVPSKVNALPVPVAAVACGGFFTMALTPELIILSCCFSHHGTWKLVMHLSYIILIGVTMI